MIPSARGNVFLPSSVYHSCNNYECKGSVFTIYVITGMSIPLFLRDEVLLRISGACSKLTGFFFFFCKISNLLLFPMFYAADTSFSFFSPFTESMLIIVTWQLFIFSFYDFWHNHYILLQYNPVIVQPCFGKSENRIGINRNHTLYISMKTNKPK